MVRCWRVQVPSFGQPVRLWFMRHRLGAVVIGSISAAALVVTFTNSLGAIAGRADATQAERTRAKDEIATDHAELARIVQERTALGQFPPATDETVTAARAAVTAAEQARVAECEKRGSRCREREKEEEGKRDSLALVLANKALTVRAAELDAGMPRPYAPASPRRPPCSMPIRSVLHWHC